MLIFQFFYYANCILTICSTYNIIVAELKMYFYGFCVKKYDFCVNF